MINEWFNIQDIQKIIDSIKMFKPKKPEEDDINANACTKKRIPFKLDINNKLKEYCVPKGYLSDKGFSYKLYLTLISNMLLENESLKYVLRYISIKDIIEVGKMSRAKILKQINNKPYILNIDGFKDIHLAINFPTNNFIKIPLEILIQLINEEEITIRTYIYLQTFSCDTIYGVTNEKLLDSIGYNSNSSNNKSKLTKGINRLIDLRFIKRDIESNGLKKYSVYSKIS